MMNIDCGWCGCGFRLLCHKRVRAGELGAERYRIFTTGLGYYGLI